MKLKIYSDPKNLTSKIRPDLFFFPFWPNYFSDSGEISKDDKPIEQHPWYGSLKDSVEVSHQLFELTSLEDCDFAILPINWITVRGDAWRDRIRTDAYHVAVEFAERVRAAGKRLVVFFSGDCSDETVPLEDVIVFRMAAYRSRYRENLLIRPSCFGDLLKNNFVARQKQDKPVVGFCGFSRPLSLRRRLQQPLYHLKMLLSQGWWGVSPYKGQVLRHRALQLLGASSAIAPNFIIRKKSFFAVNNDPQVKRSLWLEFLNNIADSDYVLCCRGSANYSMRLFEVICCGRIPIFINTDCVLPWEDVIDWKQYCVWIEEADLPNIAKRVAEFHSKLSPQEFVELQYRIRSLWKERISSEGFTYHFYHYLQEMGLGQPRAGDRLETSLHTR